MQRYAEVVQAALAALPDAVRPIVTLVSVAPDTSSAAASSPRLDNWLHHVRCALRVRGAVRRTQADLVHILDGSHAYLAALLPRRVPVVATVHDLIPLLTERGELSGARPSLPARWLWWLNGQGLGRCSQVAADSGSTARDVQRLLGISAERITVLHLPVVRSPLPAGDSPVGGSSSGSVPSVCSVGTPGPPLPIVLHVGHNAAYKNREGVLRVGALVARELPVRLVLVGPPPTSALCQLTTDLSLENAVEWRCDVGDADLQVLYGQAGVFLFPSLYEGFGWPPLEAMAAGCPVVCSNAASLPEVVRDAALTAAPHDPAALARHCLDVLTKAELRADLVRRGHGNLTRFTLARLGEQLAAVYAAALDPR
jgi:glycosyltransferase involved in cell wall biosynthesis